MGTDREMQNMYTDPNSPAGEGKVSSGTLGSASLIPLPRQRRTPWPRAAGCCFEIPGARPCPPGRAAPGPVCALAVAVPFCGAAASQGHSAFPLRF